MELPSGSATTPDHRQRRRGREASLARYVLAIQGELHLLERDIAIRVGRGGLARLISSRHETIRSTLYHRRNGHRRALAQKRPHEVAGVIGRRPECFSGPRRHRPPSGLSGRRRGPLKRWRSITSFEPRTRVSHGSGSAEGARTRRKAGTWHRRSRNQASTPGALKPWRRAPLRFVVSSTGPRLDSCKLLQLLRAPARTRSRRTPFAVNIAVVGMLASSGWFPFPPRFPSRPGVPSYSVRPPRSRRACLGESYEDRILMCFACTARKRILGPTQGRSPAP
jgi:hypothetical protein